MLRQDQRIAHHDPGA